MATKERLGTTTFDQAITRMVDVYAAGHRVVVSFSAGKDSTCLLEICIIAARLTNRLPVEVVIQDEEINFPGTYEYAERVAARPEVSFNWVVMQHVMLNCFNREAPYFRVFDPLLPPDQWVRQPPVGKPGCNVQFVKEKEISMMTIPARFPPPPGKTLYAAIGLRTSESRGRLYGGHITKANEHGVRNVRPIADWSDGDVWKAIGDNKWDYNKAYDTLMAMGIKRYALRIAPPTMNPAGLDLLMHASKAWPSWFDRVAERLPGIRTAAMFGPRAVLPTRHFGETSARRPHATITLPLFDRSMTTEPAIAMHHAGSPEWGTPMLLRRFSARVLRPAAMGRAIDLDYASSAYWNQWWDEADRPLAFLDGSKGRDVLVEADRRTAAPRLGSGHLNAPGIGGGEMVQQCWELFEKDHREARLGSGCWIGFSVEQFGSLQNVGKRNPLTCDADDLITSLVPSRRVHYVVHPERLITITQRKMKKWDRGSKQRKAEQRLLDRIRIRTDEAPMDGGAPSHLSYVTFLWHRDRAVRRVQMEATRTFLNEQQADPKSLFHKFEVIGSLDLKAR